MSEYGYHKKPVRVSPLDKLLHMQTVCPASGFLDTHNSIMSKYFFPPILMQPHVEYNLLTQRGGNNNSDANYNQKHLQ